MNCLLAHRAVSERMVGSLETALEEIGARPALCSRTLPPSGHRARLSDSRPFDIGGEEDVILFFSEDLHGFYAGGAKRGEEGGGCGDDEDEQDDGHERGKVGGGDTVEKAGEEASGGNCQGKAGEAAREADGQSLPEKSFNDLAA